MEKPRKNLVRLWSDITLEEIVNTLQMLKNDNETYCYNFLGYELDSDTVNLEEAYKKVYGMTKEEYQEQSAIEKNNREKIEGIQIIPEDPYGIIVINNILKTYYKLQLEHKSNTYSELLKSLNDGPNCISITEKKFNDLIREMNEKEKNRVMEKAKELVPEEHMDIMAKVYKILTGHYYVFRESKSYEYLDLLAYLNNDDYSIEEAEKMYKSIETKFVPDDAYLLKSIKLLSKHGDVLYDLLYDEEAVKRLKESVAKFRSLFYKDKKGKVESLHL